MFIENNTSNFIIYKMYYFQIKDIVCNEKQLFVISFFQIKEIGIKTCNDVRSGACNCSKLFYF